MTHTDDLDTMSYADEALELGEIDDFEEGFIRGYNQEAQT